MHAQIITVGDKNFPTRVVDPTTRGRNTVVSFLF
jgi:hypothetical protein